MLNLEPEEVKNYDVVELNLLCGSGLRGNENLDLEKCMSVFNQLAEMVRTETKRHRYRFQENPEEYRNSEAYYKMGMLITVIRQDFGASYNPDLIEDPSNLSENEVFFADASNVFLQGLLTGKKHGTCSSMPVLYVAIGRKLGYPVHLVGTKGHLFCRWEDEKERMNFEGTGNGVRCATDKEYQEWPFPISDEELKTASYLKNYSREQELAVFLSIRSMCLVSAKRNSESLISMAQAMRVTQKKPLTGLQRALVSSRVLQNGVINLIRENIGYAGETRPVDGHRQRHKEAVREAEWLNQMNRNSTLPNPHQQNLGCQITRIFRTFRR